MQDRLRMPQYMPHKMTEDLPDRMPDSCQKECTLDRTPQYVHVFTNIYKQDRYFLGDVEAI